MFIEPTLQIRRLSDNLLVAEELIMATRFHTRLRGLIARPGLNKRSAILLKPCGSIHTCFMRFAIDVLFQSADPTVLGISRTVQPWRCRLAPAGTKMVLELNSGGAAVGLIQPMDKLIVELSNYPKESL